MTTQRPTTITIAEVLLAIFCLTSLIPVAVDLPDNVPPPIVIYVGYVLGVLGLVVAAGLWLRKRWGTWLAIVVSPVSLLSATPGIAFASSATLRIGWCCVQPTSGGTIPDGGAHVTRCAAGATLGYCLAPRGTGMHARSYRLVYPAPFDRADCLGVRSEGLPALAPHR